MGRRAGGFVPGRGRAGRGGRGPSRHPVPFPATVARRGRPPLLHRDRRASRAPRPGPAAPPPRRGRSGGFVRRLFGVHPRRARDESAGDAPFGRPPAAPTDTTGGCPPTGASWTLPPGRSSGWAVPAALWKRFDLRLGDKAVVLPRLARELDRIDLFVYDVPHRDATSRREFRALDRSMGPGAVAIVDHGPGGELCGALIAWGARRGAVPVGRAGLGLFGIRLPGAPRG